MTPALLLGFRHEPGVETKLLTTGSVDWQPLRQVRVGGAFALSLIQHNGLSRIGLGVDTRLLDFAGLGLEAGVQHEQWNGWQSGENRVFGALRIEPVPGLRLGAGIAYRAPLLDSGSYSSPFNWQSDAPELNLLYRLEWTFLCRARVNAAAYLANFDRLTMHNPQQFPFGLRGTCGLGRGWRLLGHCGTAINGLSGLMLSLSEVTLELGVQREF